MLRNWLYYEIKPLVPWFVRIEIRRRFAARQRERHKDTWPIMPGSERPPEDWTGWPDGKQFAFILTHDVEGKEGLPKCWPLMELDKKLGFRSSFNFVPEGGYGIPRELRETITEAGFEVGVHDLRHDGKLYRSRGEFDQNAIRINRCLHEWGASGFRSGFMLHKLDWLHDLDVGYDASTFDFDPFEPQPDGCGTIFPFWVPKPGGGGYVELPYTLPQDSTLFLLLNETSVDIWVQKLDWIAEHGGMALVNVHPDYLCFSGEKRQRTTYPVELYEQFLEYVHRRYRDSLWNPLPRELATFTRRV
ncbi:MAG: hypothetical protein JO170_04070 [Verrucomicrobia bacterium]|nr:hypothetical protein [Verrucomicrobiota bacterium]